MSIEQSSVVDAIGIEKTSGDVVLTITDHLEWGKDDHEHLLLLQEKINKYLSFIESGEIQDKYPNSSDRSVVIDVVGKYALSKDAKSFFQRASSIVANAGFKLRFTLFGEN